MPRFALPITLALVCLLVFALFSQGKEGATTESASSQPAATQPAASQPAEIDMETTSYALGATIASDIDRNFKMMGVELVHKQLLEGMEDAFAGDQMRLNQEQIEQAMRAFQEHLMARQQQHMQKMQKSTEGNLADGEAFLKQHAQEEGTVVTDSGLQYKVIRPGTGPSPGPMDSVRVHYEGTHLDGRVFDSSYERGKPIELAVNRLVGGWIEALQLMKVGAKWELVLPGKLGYGEQGSPSGGIAPNEVLRFTLELLEVIPAATE